MKRDVFNHKPMFEDWKNQLTSNVIKEDVPEERVQAGYEVLQDMAKYL